MATDKGGGDDRTVVSVKATNPEDDQLAEFWESFLNNQIYQDNIDTLSSAIAFKVVLALQANAPFTAEDIERIKDHVHPHGVAYQNGFRAGFERAAEALEDVGLSEFTVSAAHLRRLLLIRSPKAAPKKAE